MALLKSKRQEVLEAIQARLQDMANRLPADPQDIQPTEYPFAFSSVEIGPLDVGDHKKRYMAGIVPGRERKQTRYPITDCTLPITIELRMTVNRGDQKPGVEMENLITQTQRIIMEDRHFGGLVIDCRETGNEVDLTVYDDKTIMGAIFFDVLYRHSTLDPRYAQLV